MDNEKKAYLYESIADSMSHLIASGTFRPGDRIPSIRAASRQMGVSITTAMAAYRLLEIRDVIEARPQSGYYVLPPRFAKNVRRPISVPAVLTERATASKDDADIRPTLVSLDRLVTMVLQDAMDSNLVQLGTTIPDPDLLPLKKLNRSLAAAVRRRNVQSLSYSFPGLEALRVQIAKRATIAGCTLRPEDIVITSGCQEAVFLALMSVCKAGDTVAIDSPAYFNHLQAMETLGLKVVEIPSHPQDGIYLDTLQYVLEETPVKACLLVSNFSNPLGSTLSDDRKRELAKILSDRDIPLIEDDIYGDLCFAAHRPRVVKAFDERGLVILCSSFSKTLAPGFRIGWTAPGIFRSRLKYQKLVCNLAAATPPQMAIAEFLASGGYDHFLRRVRRIYARRVFLMRRAVAAHFPEGTRISQPAGGFFLWVELPGHIDSVALYEKALEAGLTIAPGPIFSARQKFRNCLRLNAAIWSEKVERAVRTLGQLAQDMD
jgi:DNA-binding transcriptional MocR family regulator